jgi:hypothetical protein
VLVVSVERTRCTEHKVHMKRWKMNAELYSKTWRKSIPWNILA